MYTDLFAVNVKIHTFKMTLNNLCLEVGHGTCGVGLDLGFTVLNHHCTILIVGVGDGKCIFIKAVKEGFLCIAIILKGSMIV